MVAGSHPHDGRLTQPVVFEESQGLAISEDVEADGSIVADLATPHQPVAVVGVDGIGLLAVRNHHCLIGVSLCACKDTLNALSISEETLIDRKCK